MVWPNSSLFPAKVMFHNYFHPPVLVSSDSRFIFYSHYDLLNLPSLKNMHIPMILLLPGLKDLTDFWSNMLLHSQAYSS